MNGIVTAIIMLLAGVGVFIAGMNMLSEGLEKSAGGGLKKMLGKISNNRLAGVGIGAGVTAIIQSSSATSVMVIGFVNAGIMTLFQAAAIILGANIGTTITGVIVSLKSLGISTYATALAFIGVMMTFMKKEKLKQLGGILCGFGLIFVGLDLMSAAFDMDKFPEINEFFVNLFETIKFPPLLILCGIIFTALIQSSSAATGIFITMVGVGALELDSALFLVLGSNVGTCVTAIIASIGASVNARRTALMHLSFKVIGAILFGTLIWTLKDVIVTALQHFMPNNPQMQLAWFHVIFNTINTFILLPFIKPMVKFVTMAIKDKETEDNIRQLRFVDDRILKTPAVALMQVKKEVEYMTSLAKLNLQKSFDAMQGNAANYSAEIKENEAIIDFTNNALTKYLIKLSALVDANEEKTIGSYFHVLNDVERIGDHAENFYEIGLQMQEKDLAFSETALGELSQMRERVLKMFEIATETFDNAHTDRLKELTALENEVDDLKRDLSANHYARLAEGRCRVELSPYYSSTIAGMERVADHLINVGYSIVDPTGSQNAAKKTLKNVE